MTRKMTTFNPHAWGLFLQVKPFFSQFENPFFRVDFQSPCLGTLFASFLRRRKNRWSEKLSIPMLGDSFCKWNS